jgi:hypothetical protein
MVSIFSFFNAYHIYAHGLGCVHSDPRGVSLPEDAVSWEANLADVTEQPRGGIRRPGSA